MGDRQLVFFQVEGVQTALVETGFHVVVLVEALEFVAFKIVHNTGQVFVSKRLICFEFFVLMM